MVCKTLKMHPTIASLFWLWFKNQTCSFKNKGNAIIASMQSRMEFLCVFHSNLKLLPHDQRQCLNSYKFFMKTVFSLQTTSKLKLGSLLQVLRDFFRNWQTSFVHIHKYTSSYFLHFIPINIPLGKNQLQIKKALKSFVL